MCDGHLKEESARQKVVLEKPELFCKKGLTKRCGCSIIFERSTERPTNQRELLKSLEKVLDKLAGLW